MTTPCSIEGCAKPSRKRGWCVMHHGRWLRNGDPNATTRSPNGLDPIERFAQQVDKGNAEECWLWTGTQSGGYGRFTADGVSWTAHRYAYTIWVGPIPEGLEVDHLCAVRNCVSPRHLEPVSSAENMRRMAERRRAS